MKYSKRLACLVSQADLDAGHPQSPICDSLCAALVWVGLWYEDVYTYVYGRSWGGFLEEIGNPRQSISPLTGNLGEERADSGFGIRDSGLAHLPQAYRSKNRASCGSSASAVPPLVQ